MTDLTEHESRALARDGRVTVVRPMDPQPPEGTDRIVAQYGENGRVSFACMSKPVNGTRVVLQARQHNWTAALIPPVFPGDTLADGSRVVSVEPMRLHDAPVRYERNSGRAIRKQAVIEALWDDDYDHRPDWRYEANPWCWVMGVERAA